MATKKTPASASTMYDATTAERPSRAEIEARAYERWLQRGGPDGGDLGDWLEAERELVQLTVPARRRPAKRVSE